MGKEMGFIALTLLSSIVCGFICHYIARRRQANYRFWSMMGIAFGPLAIPFAFFSRTVMQ
ncbi:MAG: hypothetical protein OEX03_08440 [Gammaproteobacteria bacterium]|nr:hypothetical protein [Gammaproteobacteria bacterium]